MEYTELQKLYLNHFTSLNVNWFLISQDDTFRQVMIIAVLIPDFGISTVILNPVDIFRRWCKLNFILFPGYFKSRHYTAI